MASKVKVRIGSKMRTRILLAGGPYDGQDVLAGPQQIADGRYPTRAGLYMTTGETGGDGLLLYRMAAGDRPIPLIETAASWKQ